MRPTHTQRFRPGATRRPRPIAAPPAPEARTDSAPASRQGAAFSTSEGTTAVAQRALEGAAGNRALSQGLARRPPEAGREVQPKQERAAPTLQAKAGVIQRYKTKPEGLSVAGELHTKSPGHRRLEESFARSVKDVEPPTLVYWQEPHTPGTGSLEEAPASAENADHFLAWDIDRMLHHYRLIRSVLNGLAAPVDQTAALGKVQAAQVALSAESMLETLKFLAGDLTDREETLGEVIEAQTSMAEEYRAIFEGLLAGAKAGSLSGELRSAFAGAEFPAALRAIDIRISAALPELTDTRGVSYDFTRTVAMNRLANQQKAVQGVWVIGEYHVQEIEEHLGGRVEYDLVSMNDFNADVKAFAETKGGAVGVDYLGELLALSRKLSANLDYFVSGRDQHANADARLDHWERCMKVLSALEKLIATGLRDAEISQERLPGGVELADLLELVGTIHTGLDQERRATLALDAENPPQDLYQLLRDETVLQAARELNVLAGLAEFKGP